MTDGIIADGIDGIHGLRRRERTRLWYRTLLTSDITPGHLPGGDHGTDRLVGDLPASDCRDTVIETRPALTDEERQNRLLRRLGTHLDIAPVLADTARADSPAPLTDWRMVPRNAPTLLLAASALLDGRTPGPILGPGRRYRVLSAGEGVICLEVMQVDGLIAAGYCNAVDLARIEPMLVSLAGGGRGATTKQRLQIITKGLNQVAGSFAGLMS